MATFQFNSRGGRTDGRQIRPHTPWRVNNGAETASSVPVPGPSTPRTDFSSALKPRLGAMMQPTMNFSATPMPPTTPMTGAAESGAGRFAGIKSLAQQIQPEVQPPSMFAEVNDAGAIPPLNTAQKWSRTGKALSNGWTSTTPQQAQDIATRYATPARSGSYASLPY